VVKEIWSNEMEDFVAYFKEQSKTGFEFKA
jgi:hypothetical protein